MAKDYLSMQQACEALSMSEEQVKALVSQGKLHEVRDAGKVFFKKAEVVEVAGKEGSSVVDLQATDEAAPAELNLDDSETFASALSSLADSSATLGAIDESPIPDEPPPLESTTEGSSGDFGSGLALSDEDQTPQVESSPKPKPAELTVEDVPEELPAAPKGESAEQSELSSEIGLLPVEEGGSSTDAAASTTSKQQPTAEVPDLGLSGSSIISLEPGGDSSVTGSPVAKEGTKFSKVGINVFEDEDLGIETDPMGETQISSGVEDFDAVGSGSGLLDMTQESDDTSLGPELLDVISPSDAAETETEAEAVEGETVTDDASPVAMMEEEPVATEETPAASKGAAPRVATAQMAGATPLNVCMLVGLLGLASLGLATASVLQSVWPEKVLGVVATGMVHYAVFGGLALVTIVTGVLAILADRGK